MMGSSILHGDCIDELQKLAPDSIDSLVTDPPAGISFMGKEWDADHGGRDHWIAWLRRIMQECHRVMKPGAHGLVWALPRTSHWTATALEDAGFEVRDVVTHHFGSGFPKSLDVSKQIDKMAGAEREVVGSKLGRPGMAKDGSNQSFDSSVNTYGCGGVLSTDITAPATEDAKRWQGFGTALKPASEHWILIRKPIAEKNVALNVLRYGTGAINVDGCRVGKDSVEKGRAGRSECKSEAFGKALMGDDGGVQVGRFPANLVLSHSEDCEHSPHVFPDGSTAPQCADGCPVAEMDRQSGALHLRGNKRPTKNGSGIFGASESRPDAWDGISESGHSGASRFFYVAKPSKREKNAGCEGMPLRKLEDHATGTKRKLVAQAESPKNPNLPRANFHPTVKPIKLMRYLAKLVTPPGGLLLDPFIGSGTTAVAAIEEGFRFIGIEREAEYVEIARARVEHATREPAQMEITHAKA